jgi:hypothetical protein
MRPRRFQPWAEQQIAASPDIARVEPVEGDPPFVTRIEFKAGLALTVQWVGTAPPGGDQADQPERIVTGQPATPVEVPEMPARPGRADVERHLAALLTNASHKEIAEVTGYAQDERLGSETWPYGLRVRCHSGATIYGLFRFRA